jgi:excisionase family DNA binding protein
MDPKFLTRKQAAKRLKVCEATIDRWIRTGYLWASSFGPKMIRIPLTEIERVEIVYLGPKIDFPER